MEELLNNPNVLNIYPFGSKVYGTDRPDSDSDYIIITNKPMPNDNPDWQFYTATEFQRFIDNEDIKALECFYLPQDQLLKENRTFTHTLDKGKLRVAISTITSNSWVKGKKKLTVLNDYDKLIAIKSVFHSIRILIFGIQIADLGYISSYHSVNWLWSDLMKLSEQYDYDELWNAIDTKHRKIFNHLSTEFKKLCPKQLIEENKTKTDLISIFSKAGIYNKDVIDKKVIEQIINYFK